jgi:hypothetical protein
MSMITKSPGSKTAAEAEKVADAEAAVVRAAEGLRRAEVAAAKSVQSAAEKLAAAEFRLDGARCKLLAHVAAVHRERAEQLREQAARCGRDEVTHVPVNIWRANGEHERVVETRLKSDALFAEAEGARRRADELDLYADPDATPSEPEDRPGDDARRTVSAHAAICSEVRT